MKKLLSVILLIVCITSLFTLNSCDTRKDLGTILEEMGFVERPELARAAFLDTVAVKGSFSEEALDSLISRGNVLHYWEKGEEFVCAIECVDYKTICSIHFGIKKINRKGLKNLQENGSVYKKYLITYQPNYIRKIIVDINT